MVAIVLLALGALLMVGAAVIIWGWPAGVFVAGALICLAGYDLAPDESAE